MIYAKNTILKNFLIGIYIKVLNNYSEFAGLKKDLDLPISFYDDHTFYYTAQYSRLYVLCLTNSTNFTCFFPSSKKEENDIEIWENKHLLIDVDKIESQNSTTCLYGSIFSVPKSINLDALYINNINSLGSFVSDEKMISSNEALNIAKSIFSCWDLTENDMNCKIAYTYSGENFPVYDFNKDANQTSFQKIWIVSSNNVYRNITILINANTGEIINLY